MTLTLGHISYLNCVPFFYYLRDSGFDGRIVDGVPAELNRMLAEGEIDLSPSSSFEYGRNPSAYVLLPQLSISSVGPVKSVLLFSPHPLERLAESPIELTPDSATSVNLLTVLLREYLGGGSAVCRPATTAVEELALSGASVLVIGDRALRTAQLIKGETNIYDLGELWYRFTGLPFVFALWIVRKDAALQQRAAMHLLQSQLRASLCRSLADLDGLSHTTSLAGGERWISPSDLAEYWRCMSFELTQQHIAGLTLFFQLCVRHRLLHEEPKLTFFD